MLFIFLASAQESLSAVPRLIRALPDTEVIFKNVDYGFFIPMDNNHNARFALIQEAIKKGQSVSFKYDKVSRRIVSLEAGSLGVASVNDGKK